MHTNPFVKKYLVAGPGERTASYGGIAWKSVWFWLLAIGGVFVYFAYPPTQENSHIFLVIIAVTIISSLLTYWVPSATPFFGSLGAASLGYVVGFACVNYAKEYAGIVWIALAVTALVFFVMLFLYLSGIVKVGRRFRTIITTLFITAVAGGAVVGISSFFTPVLVNAFWGDGPFGLIVSVVMLLIAVLNLAVDFDYISTIVEKGMMKKFEWRAAYGLFFTIVTIFLRVLNLLSKVMGKKNN